MKVTDKDDHLFQDLVPGEFPKKEELNIIHQLFDNETIGLFHDNNKSIIHQNLLITKRLRQIYNQYSTVEFFVIDDHNKYNISSESESDSENVNESESDFESNSTNDMQQNKKHKTDKTKKPSSKLIQLTYQQAIDRIRQYLTTKKAITTSSLSIRKKATYPLNSIRKGLDESFLKLYDKETECDIDLYKKITGIKLFIRYTNHLSLLFMIEVILSMEELIFIKQQD